MDEVLLKQLGYKPKNHKLNLKPWVDLQNKIKKIKHKVKIAVVGKYTNLKDSYKSLNEALSHGGIENSADVDIQWINSEKENNISLMKKLKGSDGILIPGGFGIRGINGKINAIKYARENNIPFFGICLGMQLAVIEIAQNVLKIKNAHSSEFKKLSLIHI